MQINVIDYFERGALSKCPEKTAVRDTAGEFNFRRIAHYSKNLAALVLRRQEMLRRPVPVFLPKSAQSVIANLGVLYSGNAYANLDIKSPAQRLKGMLINIAPEVIITNAAHAPALLDLGFSSEKLLVIEEAMIEQQLYHNEELLRRLEQLVDTDPYCMIHTSGSTGLPKGVALNHRSTI